MEDWFHKKSRKDPEQVDFCGTLPVSEQGLRLQAFQTQEWIQFFPFALSRAFLSSVFGCCPCRAGSESVREVLHLLCITVMWTGCPGACRIFWCQRLKKCSAQLPVHCGKYPSKNQHFLIVHLRAFDSIPLPAWTLSDSIFHFHGIR